MKGGNGVLQSQSWMQSWQPTGKFAYPRNAGFELSRERCSPASQCRLLSGQQSPEVMNDLLHVPSQGALLTTGNFNQIIRVFLKCLSGYSSTLFPLLPAHLAAFAPCALKTLPFALAPAREDMRGKWKANSAGPRAPGSPPAIVC